jgi:hypothetical protein
MMASQLLSVLDLAVPPNSAVFVSGPVASGIRFFSRDQPLDPDAIWDANATDMELLANDLRRRLEKTVICPSRFKVPGWRGCNYREFFRDVIRRYAAEVWFVDGWEFSNGALEEFVLCQELGVPCYQSNGVRLTCADGRGMIELALRQLRQRGMDGGRFERAIGLLALKDEVVR